jgi:ribosome-binding protein aMBF1 (putative translation factor)
MKRLVNGNVVYVCNFCATLRLQQRVEKADKRRGLMSELKARKFAKEWDERATRVNGALVAKYAARNSNG